MLSLFVNLPHEFFMYKRSLGFFLFQLFRLKNVFTSGEMIRVR